MEFRFNQKFLPDFTPPQKIIDEQFAKSVADVLFQQLSDGDEKIVSISHDLKEELGGAKYEGKIFIEDIVRCKHCKHFNGIDYCFEGERGYNSIDGECFCECGRRKDEVN